MISKLLKAADDSGTGYYDWKGYISDHIGEYNKAPAGSSYAVVTIYIKNEGDKQYQQILLIGI
jgi:hypothetical protein